MRRNPSVLTRRCAGLRLSAFILLASLQAPSAAATDPPAPLALQRTADGIAGRLSDPHGQPIANARVSLAAIDVDAAAGPTERSFTSTVPALIARVLASVPVKPLRLLPIMNAADSRHRDISPVSLPIEGAPVSVRTLKLARDMTCFCRWRSSF
jgi:hypothetical protein